MSRMTADRSDTTLKVHHSLVLLSCCTLLLLDINVAPDKNRFCELLRYRIHGAIVATTGRSDRHRATTIAVTIASCIHYRRSSQRPSPVVYTRDDCHGNDCCLVYTLQATVATTIAPTVAATIARCIRPARVIVVLSVLCCVISRSW